jgi:hypothetical protein
LKRERERERERLTKTLATHCNTREGTLQHTLPYIDKRERERRDTRQAEKKQRARGLKAIRTFVKKGLAERETHTCTQNERARRMH